MIFVITCLSLMFGHFISLSLGYISIEEVWHGTFLQSAAIGFYALNTWINK